MKTDHDEHSLERFFYPRTIAVVGASKKKGKMGNLFIRNLLSSSVKKIFPIHPTEKEIAGLRVYGDVNDIPDDIDLLIPLIPHEGLLTLLKNCPKGKIRFLLAIPSGFKESSGGGENLERELIQLARERGMRVAGPNIVGMLNCTYGLNASMLPELPRGAPGLSCLTQSGGYVMSIYMYCHNHGLEMAKICDLGNTADISLHEVLDYFRRDTDTLCLGLFLECVENPDDFFSSAKAFAEEKPLILTKLGRTDAGARASVSHIGVPPDRTHISTLGMNKIIPAETGLEMLHIAKGLSWQPLPRGRKTGIITGSGGVGVELTDLCIEHGLEVPELSKKLQKQLRPHLPGYAGVQNPVDLGPIWYQYYEIYPPFIEILMGSDEIDLLVLTVIDVATMRLELMNSLKETMERLRNEGRLLKPVYIYFGAPHSTLKNMRILEEEARIPCYLTPLDTIRTAGAICRYATAGEFPDRHRIGDEFPGNHQQF